MAWSLDEIESTLLGQRASVIVLPPNVIVDAVNRVENTLGHEWIIGQTFRGISRAMNVIGMGLQLVALDGLANTDSLVTNLRRRDQNAEAELTAIYLIRGKGDDIELEPAVGGRKADFRVRSVGESQWTTVEVTQPTTSEYQQRLVDTLEKVAKELEHSDRQFSLDLIFGREPTDVEIGLLCAELPAFCRKPGQHQGMLRDDLGFMFLNHTPIVQGQPLEIPSLGPTIGLIVFVAGGPNKTPHHKISLQIPFTDERAEEILRTEARQLPKDGIGLVMINAGGGRGRYEAWTSLISRRFQPRIHTRVSAACLYEGSMVPDGPGYNWLVETRLVVNTHARLPLPGWIQDVIAVAGQKFQHAMSNLSS